MKNYVVKGNLCYSENANSVRLLPNHYLVIENGLCAGTFAELPEKYRALPLEDFGDKLIMPGMSDLHVHAPQFSFRGLGMDMELLDWLNTYTFPEESKYRDLEYADRAYESFARHLRVSATTRAAVFGTIHVPATTLLMEKMEKSGLVSYIGKVNMNRNSPDFLCETSVEQALADTEQWICDTKDRFQNTYPIITPRFIPSCTDELMHGLRKLVEKYKVPVQSHLSENYGEIAWVQELCPDSKFYGDAYDRFGLFGGDHKCIMAHCVHSGEEEIELMRKNGVYIAHSPLSNSNLSSGVAPISKYMECGMNVALASDVAGGDTENLFRSIGHAIRASKLRWRLLDQQVAALTVDQAFYIATVGGGSFFGKVGSFEDGYEFDAIVIDDTALDHPQELSLRARFERSLYLSDDRQIAAKFVRAERLF
ncbi:MAG: guanine deaminase [Ruminococcaceae bacterium]|nr:guanine deaminase [Oscillospiraceae bacterium]